MPLNDILISLLILATISLIIYLIIWLNKIGKIVDSINNDIKDLHDRVIPLIDNLTQTSETASTISLEAEKYVNDFLRVINNLFDKFSWLKGKQNDLETKKNFPGQGLFVNLRAISKGIGAFLKHL